MANTSKYQRNLEKLERQLAQLHKPDPRYDAEGNWQRVKEWQRLKDEQAQSTKDE